MARTPDRRIWRCPNCNAVNAWNVDDVERLAERDIDAVCSYGSCFDNICGACGADYVLADSPIRAECYTH